jgi:four helix bundle protein
MNDLTLFPHQKLDIYKLARELAARVRAVRVAHAELRDQAERASVSVFLALNEGLPHTSARQRAQYFTRAKASLCELVGALDLACAVGAIGEREHRELHAIAARVAAIIVALLR